MADRNDPIVRGLTALIKSRTRAEQDKMKFASELMLNKITSEGNFMTKIAEKEYVGPYQRMMQEMWQKQQAGGGPGPTDKYEAVPGATGFNVKVRGLKDIVENIYIKPEVEWTEGERNVVKQYHTMQEKSRGAGSNQPTTVDKVLGELESGGYIERFTGRTYPLRSRELAINYARSTLGIDFDVKYPRALEIINKKWPESFSEPTIESKGVKQRTDWWNE